MSERGTYLMAGLSSRDTVDDNGAGATFRESLLPSERSANATTVANSCHREASPVLPDFKVFSF
jgi:hypothetical protein